MSTINVVGAYGREYDSIITAKAEWDLGKDFKIVDGPYINISDWQEHKEDSTVVFQGNSSTWVLQEGVILDYWDKKERMRTILENMP